MKRLLAFFLLALPLAAPAQEIGLYQYQCAVTLPVGEGWNRGRAQAVPAGEMIFNASRPATGQLFALVLLPNIPSDNVEAPGVTGRILETLSAVGYKAGAPEFIQWKGAKFAQFIARRQDPRAADFIAVVRATLREKTIYLLILDGRGDASRVGDEQFMRVMESFRFTESGSETLPPGEDPLFNIYRLGAYSCAAAVGVLVFLYGGVILATRRKSYR
jgi:hypothetical protein